MSTSKQSSADKSAARRQEKIASLVTRFQSKKPLPSEDIAYIRWCGSFYHLNDITMPKLEKALEHFHRWREKRAKKKAQSISHQISNAGSLNTEHNAETKKERKQTPAQRVRRKLRAEAMTVYMDLLVPAFDPQFMAEEQMGEIFVAAFSDLIDYFYLEVVRLSANSLADREISVRENIALSKKKRSTRNKDDEELSLALHNVSFTRTISESDFSKIECRFLERLEQHKEQTVEQYQQQAKIRTLWAFYEGSFQKRWKELTNEHRMSCSERGFDIESLIQFSYDEILQCAKHYKGQWSIARARQDLNDIVEQFELAVARRNEEENQFQRLVSLYEAHSDFASCFPEARKMNRQIEFFCGPTNSGKTHAAMNELAKSKSGVYLAPLRLLALEGQENLRSRGVEASYLTGEERNIVEDATFISSTIEMLDYNQSIETAIIDEIQLIGDPQRGWAWTNALVGVPAERVLLTGSIDALPLIEMIANFLGEKLIVREFQRFNSLETMSHCSSVEKGHVERLEKGTAIVCFSRRDVLELKQHIESSTNMGVSVIYGGLAPEVRREEARRFRDKEADILVATDAISMGLNLPIRTVLFWRTYKRYGGQTHPLRDTEIKQIAGRAGRFGLEDRGYVGAFDKEDLCRLEDALKVELVPLKGPCLVMPLPLHIDLISEALHTQDLVYILRYFQERIWFSKELFFPIVTEGMLMLARMLEECTSNLSLAEMYIFTCAPVNMRATSVVQSHLSFAQQFSEEGIVELPSLIHRNFRRGAASSAYQLRDAEDAVLIATLYQWLGYRYPDSFISMDEAREVRNTINRYIARSLERGRFGRVCARCQAKLPSSFRFNICESCFSAQKNRSRGDSRGYSKGHSKGRSKRRSKGRSRSR